MKDPQVPAKWKDFITGADEEDFLLLFLLPSSFGVPFNFTRQL